MESINKSKEAFLHLDQKAPISQVLGNPVQKLIPTKGRNVGGFSCKVPPLNHAKRKSVYSKMFNSLVNGNSTIEREPSLAPLNTLSSENHSCSILDNKKRGTLLGIIDQSTE